MIGRSLLHYRIVSQLGSGGMGVVYLAEDARLKRRVALKLLPPEVAGDSGLLERFRREAETLAALNHPNVVTIHAVEEADGVSFLIEELIEGRTLAELTAAGPLPLDRFWSLVTPLVEGVSAAHRQGIVHRDLKPGNVMVADDGGVKVLDFGLAKPLAAAADSVELTASLEAQLTAPGSRMGTPAYMAPEQVRGQPVDLRTDVFALGSILYEMLSGRAPFRGATQAELAASILNQRAPRLRDLRPEVPSRLVRLIERCLEKDPARRFADAGELATALAAAHPPVEGAGGVLAALRHRPWVAAALVAVVAALAGGVLWQADRQAKTERARRELLPRIERLVEEDRFSEAYALARQAQAEIPGDPGLQRLFERVTVPVSVATDPAGASARIRDYRDPEAPWHELGVTPLVDARVPQDLLLWRIELAGYAPVEALIWGQGVERLELVPEAEAPQGMVRVPGQMVRLGSGSARLDAFWIDRHEVTNARFQEFVDDAGYDDPRWWREPVVVDGRELGFDESRRLFLDATGRPGPAGWRLGRHPEDQGDYPVGGVSWYEAAAFARWAGRELPTVWHWRAAAGIHGVVVSLSNLRGDGPSAVGAHPAPSDWGAYDMAGNVGEWCWNATGEMRYTMGGDWDDPDYAFLVPNAQLPLSRDLSQGFRTALYEVPRSDELAAPILQPVHDFSGESPAPDEIFAVYRSRYDFDPLPLEARVERQDDDSPAWRHQVVSYAAAYGDERILAHLYLPTGVEPPYQTVVYVPGSGALELRSSDNLAEFSLMDFVPRSGRAFVYPVFDEAYERKTGANPRQRGPNAVRELVVHWAQDLVRTVDYLLTREDVDSERLAFMGLSFGAEFAPIYLVVEPRFATAVLVGGGFDAFHMLEEPPEIQPWHFAPRLTVPTLMVNGRHDFLFPVETAQKPMFRLLGPSAADKRLAILEGEHLPDLDAVIRETLDWLDQRLGPVRRAGPGQRPAGVGR